MAVAGFASPATRQHAYLTLDAMRGVAAIFVVFFHLGQALKTVQLAPGGYLAVDLFFVLSGFVVAHAYEARLAAGLSSRTFLWIRLIRFYPLFLVGLLLGTLKAVTKIAIGDPEALTLDSLFANLVLALAFLPSPFGKRDELFPLITVAWSLFFELTVNAVYAIIRPWLTVGVLLLIIGMSGLGLALEAVQLKTLDEGAHWAGIQTGALRVTFSFFVGLLMYRKREILLPLVPAANPWLLPLILAVLLAVWIPTDIRQWYDLTFMLVASPFLVLFGAKHAKQSRIFAFLGIISYPLYTVHEPIAATAQHISRITGLSPWAVTSLVAVGLIYLSAVLAYRYDLPARRWLAQACQSFLARGERSL